MSGGAGDLRRTAVRAFLWSLVQNWGGRAVAMLVFLVLGRLLSPGEFGLAASAILVFSVVSLVSELGFGDAVIQNKKLEPEDANAPFFLALGLSALLSLVAALLADRIAALMGNPQLAPLLMVTCAAVPFAVATGFQEAMLKRALEFRRLALRTLACGVAAGFVGIGMAFAGFGGWALVGQFVAQILLGFVWLWARPVWRPNLRINLVALRTIGTFGSNLIASRLVDFAAQRTVDFLIVTQLGTASYGVFALSNRLYQFLMQLFQNSVSSVGLTVLSEVSDDRDRIRRLFVRTTSISAMLGAPPFFLLAGLAPELRELAFGPRWTGAEAVMTPLLLVGGVHSILFGAGSYLNAAGRPDLLLRLMLLKAGLVLLPILLIRPAQPDTLAVVYAAGLIAEAPFTIHATLRTLSLPWMALARPVGGPMLAGVAAFAALRSVDTYVTFRDGMWLDGGCKTAVFAGVHLIVVTSLARGPMGENVAFLRGALLRR
ncbi:oligosaccharide flippase family protein [Aureimonas leprariae]|uniref:Oligosaccharide flippase family protein n=1 Tax=Plantimonas leprariae TaxID=2615207 RepID=A0A7V7TWL7_9HYPH|nr:oligosaccharide flippase family protein [Aureimonas leprariae]KAB0679814.1 oligosaccharide flippase family protein [Aureimonas leprariae]